MGQLQTRDAEVGTLSRLLHALRSNQVHEILGVDSCPCWTVSIWNLSPETTAAQPVDVFQQIVSVEVKQSGHRRGLDDLSLESQLDAIPDVENEDENDQLWSNCAVDMILRDDGFEVGIAVAEALQENTTVKSLLLQVKRCTQVIMRALIKMLRENVSLESLTLESVELVDDVDINEDLCLSLLEMLQCNACLQSFKIMHDIANEEKQVPLSEPIRCVLESNKFAFLTARALGQTARVKYGSFGSFGDAAFRMKLLAFFLGPRCTLPPAMSAYLCNTPGI